jgi:hypothetical protein
MTQVTPAGPMSSHRDYGTRDGLTELIQCAIGRVHYEQARSGTPIADFRFGDFVLGVRAQPGGTIAELTTMFDHHRVRDRPRTALLDIIDGPDAALAPLLPSSRTGRDRFVLSTPAVYCLWDPEGGGKLTAVDREKCLGVVWYPAATALPSWEKARPLIHAFKALFPASGLMPVHGAAVALGERGILIAGGGGAGKTTMALACVEAGWRYVGDDGVLIGGAPLRAFNLFRSARLREDMFRRLPRSLTAAYTISTDSGEVKAELDVGRLPSAAIGDAIVSAIIVPRRLGSPGIVIAPLRQSVALRELSATTLVALPGDPAESYEFMAHALRDARCFSVDPGPVLGAVPAALERLAAGG